MFYHKAIGTLLNTVNELHEARTLDELGEAFRGGFSRLVPGDIHEILVFGSGEDGGDVYLATPDGLTDEERRQMLEFLDETPDAHPVSAHHLRHGSSGPVRVSDLIGLGPWRRSEFYNRFNRRMRHDFELDCLLPGASSSGMAAVSSARSGKDFTDQELAVLRHLQRPLTLALARLLREKQFRRTEVETPRPEVLLAVFPVLTPREADVLHWIIEGKSDPEIALILGQSRLTTSTHTRNLLRKMGVNSRLGAAIKAVKLTIQ